MDDERAFWIAFSVFPGIGPLRFKLLRQFFGSAKVAWQARESDLRAIKLGDSLVTRFLDFRKSFSISSYLKTLADEHISILVQTDPKYPALLSQIPDAPFVLYIKGKRSNEPWNIERSIAVVGTRKITHYGSEVTRRLVEELVYQGFTIVSGLAYGVDAAAHQATIDSGGKTIAVLGCGIDIIAPPSNATLYWAIANGGGAIISEMPLGLRPNKGLFPARNRIISGLSLGVVVTEGADDSGALITARYAGEQGREVFAVPGPITSPYSRGPAKLLKSGAKLVESVDDILEELGVEKSGSQKDGKTIRLNGENEKEQKVLDCLADRRMQVDVLVRETGLTTSEVLATVTILEMRGIVKDYGEKEYGLA